MSDRLGLQSGLRQFKKDRKRILTLMANEAVNMFKITNFNASAFVDTVTKRWEPRKSLDLTKTGRVKKRQRKLLVKSGRLRRSIRKKTVNSDFAIIENATPYAVAHNEGTNRLPQRQFMGQSKILDIESERLMLDIMDDNFKKPIRKQPAAKLIK